MMRCAWILTAAALGLTGCKPAPSPTQRAADDAKAIAQVEAANRSYGPPVALNPEPILPADLERAGLLDAGCAFEAEDQADPFLIARPKRAMMKFGRNLTSFASDPGSPALPLGTWTHYVGKAGSLRILKADGDGGLRGQGGLEWNATLIVTDEHDRTVFTTPGRLRCGA
jgi:hypothetical protein